MSRDILFKTEDHVFSYRVGGILVENGKVLLQRDKNGDHAVIGGHVAFLETTEETLKREFLEEIHAEIAVDQLVAVQENFFMWGSKPCHQVHFYYNVHLEDTDFFREGMVSGYDELDNMRVDLDYIWIPLEELQNIPVYPRNLSELLEPGKAIRHFVYRELE